MSTTTQAPPTVPGPARRAIARRDVRASAAILGVGLLGLVGSISLGLELRWGLGVLAASLALLLLLGGLFRFEAFLLSLIVVRAPIDSLGGVGPVSVNAVLSVLFLLFAGVWLAGKVREGIRPVLTTWPSVLLATASLISVLGASQQLPALVDTLRLCSGLLMLEVVQRLVVDRARLERLLAALLASAVVPVAVALFQMITGSGMYVSGFIRVVGTFHHPNPFSIYLVLIALTALALIPNVPGRVRVPLVLLSAAVTVVLVGTLTRSAWIALAIGVLVLGVLQTRVLIPLLIAGAAVAAVLSPDVMARVTDLAEPSKSSVGDPTNSLAWRLDYWSQSLELSDGRLVTGIGLGGVQRTADEAKAPHNDFVRVFVEMGVLGLAGYVWLIGALVALAWRCATCRFEDRGPPRGAARAWAAALAAVLVVSIVSNVISQVVLVWYIAVVAGAGAAAVRIVRDDPQVDHTEAHS